MALGLRRTPLTHAIGNGTPRAKFTRHPDYGRRASYTTDNVAVKESALNRGGRAQAVETDALGYFPHTGE